MASEKVYVGKAGAKELYRTVKGDIGSLSDTVDGKLALKADQATLDAGMASVNEALATKASMSALESAVSDLGQRINTKADANTVTGELALKEDLANKVTSFGGQPTNVQYPSALLVKTEIDRLQQEIANLGGFEVVTTLVDGHPNPEIPSHKIIYLYKDPQGPEADPYTEWIYTVNNEWDVIGTTYVDLTPYYTSGQVDLLLATKVDKVTGKGLSTNDYTAEDKNKLTGIESGAEVNLIETVKVDGTALSVDTDKAVNIPLASATDSGNETVYVTGAVTGQDKQKWDSWASAVFPIIPKPNIVVIGDRTYPTVKIGNQMWMAENLNLTWPTLELNQTTVSTSKARANYYGNASSAEGTKGLLYNGPAVTYIENNSGILEIPSGWHVATLNDWNTLCATVGGTSVAAKKLKTTSGWAYDSNGTDDYGFAAVPGGLGQESTFSSVVTFQNGTDKAFYWASDATVGRYYALLQTGDNAQCDMFSKTSNLLSVRLVKNLA